MSERGRVINEIRDWSLQKNKASKTASDGSDAIKPHTHMNFLSRLGAATRTAVAPDNLRSFVKPIQNRNLKRAEPGATVIVTVPGSVVEAFKTGESKVVEQALYIIPKIEYTLEGKRRTPVTRREIRRHFKLGRKKNFWTDMYNNANYLVTMTDGSEGLFSVEAYGSDEALLSTTTLRSRTPDSRDGKETFHYTQIISAHSLFARGYNNIHFVDGELTRPIGEVREIYAPIPYSRTSGADLTDLSADPDHLTTFDIHLGLLEKVNRHRDKIKVNYYDEFQNSVKANG